MTPHAAVIGLIWAACLAGCGAGDQPADPRETEPAADTGADGATDGPIGDSIPPAEVGDVGLDGAADSGDATADSGDASGDTSPPSGGLTRYLPSVRHSPLTTGVLEKLRPIVAASKGRKDVFAKVGASNTVNTNFVQCFAGTDVKLGPHTDLDPSWKFFKKTKADATRTSYDRTTLSATVGWGAAKTIEGSPSPIELEVAAINPAFAVVLLGTNDTYETGVGSFERNLGKNIDSLLSLGVVPLVSTIPPRGDKAEAIALAPEMNMIIRAVAQSRQVPFMDLEKLCESLPDKGLVGDGVHLSVYVSGGPHGCWLDGAPMLEGMNQRNLLTLEALDRARRFLVETAAAEPDVLPLSGVGSWVNPWLIDTLPFVDASSTATSTVKVIDRYSCGSQDEGGPERVYALDLAVPTLLRARVFSDEGADLDLHALRGPKPEDCIVRGDKRIDIDAPAGRLYISVDSFVSGGTAKPGGYRLILSRR